jgi:predicted Fe-Mo cluster-binding NifX family protein
MKKVITSTGNSLLSEFDLRFGRAGWFCIYDIETGKTQFIKNKNKDLNGGAGTKSAELVAELGATQIISGDFGPKAKSLLEKMKIQMVVIDGKSKTIQEIIDLFNN